jgi:hypothetical protein
MDASIVICKKKAKDLTSINTLANCNNREYVTQDISSTCYSEYTPNASTS